MLRKSINLSLISECILLMHRSTAIVPLERCQVSISGQLVKYTEEGAICIVSTSTRREYTVSVRKIGMEIGLTCIIVKYASFKVE